MEDRLEAITARMLKISSDVFPGPASEAMIREAEQELGATFPESYHCFLAKVGAADFPFEVFGIAPEHLPDFGGSYWSVIDMTQSERQEVEPPLLHHLIPISPNGMGDHWCLDTSCFHLGECPVVFWNHENGPDQRPNQTHATFLDWLDEIVTLEEENSSA